MCDWVGQALFRNHDHDLCALKFAIDPQEHGIMIAGGKGKNSRKIPLDIKHLLIFSPYLQKRLMNLNIQAVFQQR